MNIVKRKSDNVVIFSGDDITLDKSGCRGDGWVFNKIDPEEMMIEKVDYLPEGFFVGFWMYSDGVWSKTAEGSSNDVRELTDKQNAALMEIDLVSDDLVNKVIGRRDIEYLMAEKQAQSYIDSGYKGNTFPYVSSWAKAKDETDKWAADNIIETANNWRDIQSDVREKRLAHKEMIRSSETIDSINETLGSWYNYINSVKIGLGVQ